MQSILARCVCVVVGLLPSCGGSVASSPAVASSQILSRVEGDLDGDGITEFVYELSEPGTRGRTVALFEGGAGRYREQQRIVLGEAEIGAEPVLLWGRAPALLGLSEVAESGTGVFQERQRWFELRDGQLDEVLAIVREATQRGGRPLDARVRAHVERRAPERDAGRRPRLVVTYMYRFGINPYLDDAFVVRLDDVAVLEGFGVIRFEYDEAASRYVPISSEQGAPGPPGSSPQALTEAQWRALERVPGLSAAEFLSAFGDRVEADPCSAEKLRWLRDQAIQPPQ